MIDWRIKVTVEKLSSVNLKYTRARGAVLPIHHYDVAVPQFGTGCFTSRGNYCSGMPLSLPHYKALWDQPLWLEL
jgi:hypothetical protein